MRPVQILWATDQYAVAWMAKCNGVHPSWSHEFALDMPKRLRNQSANPESSKPLWLEASVGSLHVTRGGPSVKMSWPVSRNLGIHGGYCIYYGVLWEVLNPRFHREVPVIQDILSPRSAQSKKPPTPKKHLY